MADTAALLYRTFLKKAPVENKSGLPDNVWSMCRVIDHTAGLGYYDRDRYDVRIKALEARDDRKD